MASFMNELRNVAFKTFWTFAQVFLALIVVDGTNFLNTTELKKAAVAGLASAIVVVKEYVRAKAEQYGV